MFQNVIVGVDGSEGGRDAIAFAQALGASKITLVAAYPAERTRWRGAVEGYFELLRDDAVKLLDAARAEAHLDAETVAHADPSPARALQHLAAERGADLIVVGSAHHGPVARLVLGDVGRGVLHDAPCAVAVVPRGYREHAHELRRVAVGFDGTPEAQAALDAAAGWAQDAHAALTVHSAWEVSAVLFSGIAYTPDIDAIAEAERERATAATQQALEDLPWAESRIARGRPAEVLEAAAKDADLLVVGSRGWGAARRIAVGSTSDHLVHHAACPVIVIPRPAASSEASNNGAAGGTEAARPAATQISS